MTAIITPQLIKDALNTRDQSIAIDLLRSDKEVGGLDDKTRIQLQYVRFNSLSPSAVSALLSESVLTPFELENFSITESLKQYIEQYDYVPDIIELCGQIPAILSNNQEQLGNQPLIVGDKKVPPTISNWLNHYAAHSTSRDGNDILGLMKYINNDPDVRLLNDVEKQALKDIIRLQDYCNQVLALWNALPENISEEEANAISARLKLQDIDEGIADEIEDTEDATQVAVAPERTTPSFRIPLQKNLDLSTQPKSGLVFDQPTNVNLDQEASIKAEEKRNQMAIQAKLEALKQRQATEEDSKS